MMKNWLLSLFIKEEEVSTEGNLTDEDKGQLRFKRRRDTKSGYSSSHHRTC